MGAVFGQINQGAGVTAGLRKVTADMKAKNRAPSDRSGKVAAKTAPSAPAPAKAKGPAKLELQGNKWVVENQVRSLTPAPRVVRLPAGWLILVLVLVRQLPSLASLRGWLERNGEAHNALHLRPGGRRLLRVACPGVVADPRTTTTWGNADRAWPWIIKTDNQNRRWGTGSW